MTKPAARIRDAAKRHGHHPAPPPSPPAPSAPAPQHGATPCGLDFSARFPLAAQKVMLAQRFEVYGPGLNTHGHVVYRVYRDGHALADFAELDQAESWAEADADATRDRPSHPSN
jgi:hypothetical protein